MSLCSLEEWLTWISALHPKTIDLSLERIKSVAYRLGQKPFQCPVITVGGTNGKGSCVAFLASIYQQAGYRVGTYTSPHLLRFNERIAVNQLPIEDERLCQAFGEVKNALGTTKLTFFEFTTLTALHIFSESSLDVLILEVGMGGRCDAVNIVDPTLSIIATVSLDHMEFLGHSRESIGFEKAGILRSKQPAVCGDFYPPKSLLQQAKNIQARLYCQGQDFRYTLYPDAWRWQHGEDEWKLPIPTLPIQNAATSLMAVHLFKDRLPISEQNIKQGVFEARLMGRYQMIQEAPKCIVDVAHNPEAAHYLCQKLKQETCSGRTWAIFGMRQDKAISEVATEMLPVVDEWHLATLAVPNGASAEELLHRMPSHGRGWQCHPSPQDALSSLLWRSKPHDRIIAFGSFHTVQAILEFYGHTKD
ncbi:MAG: bifunctional tetrahydrofolate synthase/dihydrofolate synthase [Gammaproteobacteria bacterium]|nr:bifunctional tetrahydrofolate synthase/dihydrofolate synthase [Gammaproteobacteria bacterium]